MAVTFWNIPGIQSHKSLEVLERSLSPICVYSELGQTIYASQSFLKLLPVAEAVDFLGCFSSESTSKAVLKSYWGRALQGETVDFLASYGDVRQEIECSLQFNPDAKLMFLTVKKAGSDGDTCRLINEYERAVALFDRSSLATALINPEGAIIKCNEQFHSLLGTSDREIIQLEKFVHPEDKLLDVELKQRLLDGDINSYTIEKRLISHKHEVIWVNATFSLIEMPVLVKGFQKYFVAVLEDITESRKVYHALVRTEEKWKAFVLNSPYLFIQTSNAGQIIYISPAVEQLLDYKDEELLGRYVTEFIHSSNINEFELSLQLWASDIQSSKPGIECWWRARSGRWIALYIQGQRFPSVLEIDGIVISGYDITDRKCLEIELKASEEKYKSLVLNVPGAVFRCDSTYTMEFVSDRIEEITGYPAATFINNQRQSYLSIIYPEDITLIKDSLLQSVLDRYRCSIEYRIIHASGQIRWVSERKQGTFDQRGNLIWLDGVLQDISDRKRVEDEHRRSKAKRKLAETELRRCQAVNRAMAQLMPEYMRSNNQEAFQAFIVSRNIGSSD